MSGEKRRKAGGLWPCWFWGNSAAIRWRMGITILWQWARKTLSPLVVHNNLQIDLNEPDLFLDSDSLSQLPKDLPYHSVSPRCSERRFRFLLSESLPIVWALKAAFAALSMNTISR